MKKHFVILLVGLIVSTGADAVNIRGVRSCGVWVADRAQNSFGSRTDEAWFVGFMSGLAAMSGKDIITDSDNESLFLWVDNYCKINPLNSTGEAAEVLFLELIKKKGL